jgi:hypothetical protein
MGLAELLPLFAQSGVFGLVTLVAYWLHRDAVRAHDQRADDWKAAYEREVDRADERERQLEHILTAVRQATTTGTGL